MTDIGRSASGRRNRQLVLDYLNQYGESTTSMIARDLSRNHRYVTKLMQTMRSMGDVTFEIKPAGNRKVPHYTAAVATTKAMTVEPDSDTDVSGFVSKGPWHTGNRCSNKNPPIKNQGGQGAVSTPLRGTTLSSVYF